MKLLLVAPDINRSDILQSYSGNVAFNVCTYIKNDARFAVDISPELMGFLIGGKSLDVADAIKKMLRYDAVLFFGLKILDRPYNNVTKLIRAFKSINSDPVPLLFQMADSAVGSYSNADYTFCTRSSNVKCDRDVIVGWGAASEMFTPIHNGDNVNILLDHPDYTDSYYSADISNSFISELLEYKKHSNLKITCNKFISGGICSNINIPATKFDRVGIPYLQYVNALNSADIFVVTHPESVGLSALEASMAGCKVILPSEYIPNELISTIDHVIIGRSNFNFDEILLPHDKIATSNKAKAHSFNNLSKTIANKIYAETFK